MTLAIYLYYTHMAYIQASWDAVFMREHLQIPPEDPAFVDAIGKPSKTAAEWRAEKEPDLHSVTTASRLPERPPRSNLSSAHVQRLISGGDAHVLWARAGDGSTKLSSAIARGAGSSSTILAKYSSQRRRSLENSICGAAASAGKLFLRMCSLALR